MSRRTKLIITAIFLVLLAIPVVYLALTWSPKDPLRFRLIRIEMPEEKNPYRGIIMHLEVENTSFAPIQFGDAQICDRPKPGAHGGAPYRTIFFRSPGDSVRWNHTIASRSTQHFSAGITDDDRMTVEADSAEIFYLYKSHTKSRAEELWSYALEHLPGSTTGHSPRTSNRKDRAWAAIELRPN